MLVSTAVVAHSARKHHAYDLAATLDASLAYDPAGTYGPGTNHRRAWQLANTSAAHWIMVVEDDALPCADFINQLAALLPTAPTPVVSLYLGTNYPPHLAPRALRAQAEAARQGEPWLTLATCNHAVALAIRQPLVDHMLANIDTDLPIDEAISDWATQHGHAISYPTISLVDHRDEPTVINHPDGQPRSLPRRAIAYHP